ncbi:MAG: DNA mismatch repair endonuclease MutL [Acidobacteriota bacterium]
MSRIRVLPEALASRIAAGEVIERPASVVKELVENALDAEATRIEVELAEGGRARILVRDDGRGMDRDDAVLAFDQHATSKLSSFDELSDLPTHGFRGEALAAIGSCSEVVMTTATSDGEGTRVQHVFGTLRSVEAVGAPRGTSLEVTRLFAELPARRKFLRRASTEQSHCQRVIEHLALARPEIGFRLTGARGRLVDLPAVADLGGRVRQLLGSTFVDEAHHVTGRQGELEIEAWLLPAGEGLGRLGPAVLLVNGRVVQDRLLTHALREASGSLFGRDEMPTGLLRLTLPGDEVDINVHPAKRELRFTRPSQVHDAVRDLCCGGETDVSRDGPRLPDFDALPAASSTAPAVAEEGPSDLVGPELPTPAPIQTRMDAPPSSDEAAPPPGPRPWDHDRRSGTLPGTEAATVTLLGQLRDGTVAAEDERGLLLVEPRAAHAELLVRRWRRECAAGQVGSQALLEGQRVGVPPRLRPRLEQHREALDRLGLSVDDFGPEAVLVRSVPAGLGAADAEELLLAALTCEGRDESEDGGFPELLARRLAARGAGRPGARLSLQRQRFLVESLLDEDEDPPRRCLFRIGHDELARRFGAGARRERS